MEVYFVFSFQLVLSSHQVFTQCVPSFVLFLWARVSVDDSCDVMGIQSIFLMPYFVARDTSSSKHSNNAIFILNSLIIFA